MLEDASIIHHLGPAKGCSSAWPPPCKMRTCVRRVHLLHPRIGLGGVTMEPIKQPFAPEILDFLHPVHQAVVYSHVAQHTGGVGAAKDLHAEKRGMVGNVGAKLFIWGRDHAASSSPICLLLCSLHAQQSARCRPPG